MTNQERRDAGLAYRADEAILGELMTAHRLLQKFNTADPADTQTLQALLRQLLQSEQIPWIFPPFRCDYGSHISVGKNVFINYNCTLLDVGKITIGDNTMLAPNVAIYTAGHPLHPDSRNSGYEYGADVTIGKNVWIGGSVVITPGVTIGESSVIGAGSVVTKDIPAWSLAVGNPCRVIRTVTEEDRKFYFKDRVFDEAVWKQIRKDENHETV